MGQPNHPPAGTIWDKEQKRNEQRERDRLRKLQEEKIRAVRRGSGGGGTGDGGCFSGDSLVVTATGKRRIDSVLRGDLVLVRYANGTVTERPVIRRQDHKPGRFWKLRTDKTPDVRVTAGHRFVTERGAVSARELQHNDRILLQDGSYATVRSIEKTPESGPVYNLVVDGTSNTYMVEGLVVYTFGVFPRLLHFFYQLMGKLDGRTRKSVATLTGAMEGY